jgi:hypothetical protein
VATVPSTYVPGILPLGEGPHTPHTILFDYNRNNIPWRANAYVCQHGYDMSVCSVGDENHRGTGERMTEWFNELPQQHRDRTVVRNRLNGGTF